MGDSALTRLRLKAEHWQAIVRQVEAERPNEACGLLAGLGGVAARVCPVPSAEPSPVAYRMQPEAQIRTMLEIEAEGLEVTAIYHSHPAGPAAPSPTDVANAFYPDSLYLIVSPGEGGGWQGRAFWIVDGRVSEVRVELDGA